MTNFLTSRNPFNLPAPPAWWLQRLHDLDEALVIFPSTIKRAYILARRRSHSLRMPALVELDKNLLRMSAGGDGDLLADNNLVFVEQIIGWGVWTDKIFADLRARDIWAAGGAEKFNQRIVNAEQAEREKRRTALLDDIDHRARDAYRSLKARTGQRNQRANSGTKAKIVQVGTL